jgi:hypothetical protein
LVRSAEHTRFRCAPLNALERALHPMRRTGLQSRCVQCGLPRCPHLHLLPPRATRECQIPTAKAQGAQYFLPCLSNFSHLIDVTFEKCSDCASGKPCVYFLWFFYLPQVEKVPIPESTAYLKKEIPSAF